MDRYGAIWTASHAALVPPAQAAFHSLAAFRASFDRPAGRAVIGGPAAEAGDLLNELVVQNLLVNDETSARFRWHDLLRDFAQRHGTGLEAAGLRHAQHFIAVGREFDRPYKAGGDHAREGLALFE